MARQVAVQRHLDNAEKLADDNLEDALSGIGGGDVIHEVEPGDDHRLIWAPIATEGNFRCSGYRSVSFYPGVNWP